MLGSDVVVAVPGFEPGMREHESRVIPLHYTAVPGESSTDSPVARITGSGRAAPLVYIRAEERETGGAVDALATSVLNSFFPDFAGAALRILPSRR